MKILLSCQGGFSSSLVVSKMKEEAKKRALEVTILTVDQGSIVDELDDAGYSDAFAADHLCEGKI